MVWWCLLTIAACIVHGEDIVVLSPSCIGGGARLITVKESCRKADGGNGRSSGFLEIASATEPPGCSLRDGKVVFNNDLSSSAPCSLCLCHRGVTPVPQTPSPPTRPPLRSTPSPNPSKGLSEGEKGVTTASAGAVATTSAVASSLQAVGGSGVSVGKASGRAARTALYTSLLECPRVGEYVLDPSLHPTALSLGDGDLRHLRGALVGNSAIVFSILALLLLIACAKHRLQRLAWSSALASTPFPLFFLALEYFWGPSLQGAFAMVLNGSRRDQVVGAAALLIGSLLLWGLRWIAATAKVMAVMEPVVPRPTGVWRLVKPSKRWRPLGGFEAEVEWRSAVFDGYLRGSCTYFVVQLLMVSLVAGLGALNPDNLVMCAGRAGVMCGIPAFWTMLLVKDRPYVLWLENIVEIAAGGIEFLYLTLQFWGAATLEEGWSEAAGVVATVLMVGNLVKFSTDLLLLLFSMAANCMAHGPPWHSRPCSPEGCPVCQHMVQRTPAPVQIQQCPLLACYVPTTPRGCVEGA